MDRRAFLLAAAAAPFGLRLADVASGALEAWSPLAFVTADLDSHVAVVDLERPRVVARIPTFAGPRSIETVGKRALVAHTAHGRISLVDTEARRVRHVLDGFGEPRYTAARRGLAYVTDSARGEVVTVDVPHGSIVERTRVPGPARHVTSTPDGEAIWTALGSKASRIAVLDARDPRRPKLARTVAPPFRAHDVVAAPDGEHVWVTSGDSRRLAVYERRGRRPLEIIAADAPPQHVAFAGDLAFVASGDDGTVRVHRHDGTLVREVEVPVGSYNVTFGSSCAVTPSLDRGTVALLEPNGRIRTVLQIARAAHDACVVTGV